MAEKDEYNRVYEDIPGMKEALATFDTSKAKPVPKLISAQLPLKPLTAQRLAKVEKSLRMIAGNALVILNSPHVLVTAQPWVAKIRLERAMDELSSIPEGKALVDAYTAAMGAPKSITDLTQTLGGSAGYASATPSIEPDGQMKLRIGGVFMAPSNTGGVMIAVMAHELRHYEQMATGSFNPVYSANKTPSPIEMLWFNRAIEADASATQVDISWKLKQAGKSLAWNAMTSPLCPPIYRRLSEAYEAAVKKDPAAATDGRAKREAFDAWFEAGPFAPTLSQTYNPHGVTTAIPEYSLNKRGENGIPFTPITAGDVERLGNNDTVNYLKIPGFRPLDDPYYRKADWNPAQAAILKKNHELYDSVVSKFSSPKQADPAAPAAPKSAENGATQKQHAPGLRL